MAKSSPLERTSVQLMIGAALLALLANSAVDQTDDKLPWEVTLTGFCLFAVVFAAIYAKRTEVAVSIVTIVGMIVPTYFVHYMEVPCSNWLLGSQFPLAAPPKEVLAGIFAAAPNASRYDGLLPGGLSVYHFSLFNPSMAVTANTSEIYHSGLMLDDKLTKARTHDYLLLSSPRKVRRKTEAVSILARVPTKFVVWPPEAEDYSFSLQTASNMVMPPTLIGELVKLDKGTPLRTSAQFCAQLSGAILSDASSTTLAGHAIDVIKSKHNLRPFLLDVYKVCWGDPGDPHFNPDTCKDHNNYNDGDDENYP
jgi:hypothetical protein